MRPTPNGNERPTVRCYGCGARVQVPRNVLAAVLADCFRCEPRTATGIKKWASQEKAKP